MQRAVILMLLGMTLIPAGDTANKLLTGTFGVAPMFSAWSRFVIGALCILPFVRLGDYGLFRSPVVWIRGLLLGLGISAISMALRTEDLANAFGGLFMAPIVSYITAVLFLKEQVTWPRTILIILGFVGVLLVAKPGGEFSAGMGFALLAGTTYGVFLTVSRVAAPQFKATPLLLSQLVIAALVTLPFAMMDVPRFNVEISSLLAASGIGSMLGNLMLIMAYGLAPATRMAPLVYFQLIAALVLGWFVFDAFPDVWGLAGLFLIAGSGFATFALRR